MFCLLSLFRNKSPSGLRHFGKISPLGSILPWSGTRFKWGKWRQSCRLASGFGLGLFYALNVFSAPSRLPLPIIDSLKPNEDGSYGLAEGPRAEGVVMMWMGAKEEALTKAFFSLPWIDAVTKTVGWRSVEPRDQEFDFKEYDQLLALVREYNAVHRDSPRAMHVRVVGGRFVPDWFEQKGVRFYDTPSGVTEKEIHIPIPFDNPELIKQTRELYRAMYEHFKDAPEVVVFHGTWSGGPWEEIFHARKGEPLPPGYTPEKYIRSMLEQLDLVIDEFSQKGKIGELSYSGLYPPKSEIDITGPINARVVQRLGKHSPYFVANSDGWGCSAGRFDVPVGENLDRYKISVGHEQDINDTIGLLTVAAQAWGDNWGTKPGVQGDWVELVKLLQAYDCPYAELYASDLVHLDTRDRIVQAFTQTQQEADSGQNDAVPGFLGYRPWLKQRARRSFVREGSFTKTIRSGTGTPVFLGKVALYAEIPVQTYVACKIRSRVDGMPWSNWSDSFRSYLIPAGNEFEFVVTLHTDDGLVTPVFHGVTPDFSDQPTPRPADKRSGKREKIK